MRIAIARVRLFRICLCAGLCAVAAMFALVPPSWAQSLKITKFTVQTTRTVKTPIDHESFGFENVPYAFTQAGGHPEGLTTTVEFENETIQTSNGPGPVPTRDVKDVSVAVPPGLLGNPTAVPLCPLKQVLSTSERCPASTQLGFSVIHLLHGEALAGPVVNITPEAGQSAEFAIETRSKFNFLLTAHVVRTPEGYGLTVEDNGITSAEIVSVETTFWGVPAAHVNDPERGLFCGRLPGPSDLWGCGVSFANISGLGGEKSGIAEVPFLTMPSNCAAGPETVGIKADSWEQPVRYENEQIVEGEYAEAQTKLPGATGCNLLQFAPGVGLEPDTALADSPVALGVNVTVPQFEQPQRLSTPELRSAVVTLPLGMSISPGIVDGIRACDESGPEGIDFAGPESEEIGLNGEPQLAPGHCPDASTVGTAEAITPLLSEPVKGHVYLARPGCGGAGERPCTEQDALDGNLYKLYLELGGTGPLAKTGVHLKIPGETQANLATGQLTTRFEGFEVGDPPHFEGNPQLPFSELKVRLNGGPRAPIANPAVCGPATTTADFKPWSAPGFTPIDEQGESVFMAGLPDATPSSFFRVEGCAAPPQLHPGFLAGTVIPNAGKFSPFTLNIAREDREQYVKGVQVQTPPGLSGVLAGIPLCDAAEAEAGSCSQASKIGTTRVASGAGSHPFEIEGQVYLTGPYRGAPFGLSIVTHVVAGPFDLGLVVVRARIDVNPENATLTVTADETGPHALPQIIFGVPVRLKRIAVDIDRPGFMFNPTSCAAQQITAVVSGAEQAVATVHTPFAAGRCTSLAFEPKFTASTSGHTSRAAGASLDVKLAYPKGALGNDANVARVKVSLPKQLPSRLSTLQHACTAAQFARNPAGCPSASIVGIAKADTPLLPVPLSGPVYFVSHGGEQFPSLVVVLEGDNVRVDLIGSTFISKAGITTSTFKTVPDAPVGSFQLYLPEGRFSALAANTNLCKAAPKLKMPTEFIAQNGLVFKQSTQIAVGGCRAKPARRAKSARRRHTGAAASYRSNREWRQGR